MLYNRPEIVKGVLTLHGRGLSNVQIGREMRLTLPTVKRVLDAAGLRAKGKPGTPARANSVRAKALRELRRSPLPISTPDLGRVVCPRAAFPTESVYQVLRTAERAGLVKRHPPLEPRGPLRWTWVATH